MKTLDVSSLVYKRKADLANDGTKDPHDLGSFKSRLSSKEMTEMGIFSEGMPFPEPMSLLHLTKDQAFACCRRQPCEPSTATMHCAGEETEAQIDCRRSGS